MALDGSLCHMEIAHLLHVVGSARKSGVLMMQHASREAKLFFQQGRLVRAASNQVRHGIGALLVEAGCLSAQDLESALAVQRREGGARRLGGVLLQDFNVCHEDIQRLLLEQARRIVFDVFSWPHVTFSFRPEQAPVELDSFHHDPLDLIHEVGIHAGVLATEGMAWERAAKRD